MPYSSLPLALFPMSPSAGFQELLVYRLTTIHNLRFISELMRKIRESIINESFPAFRESFLAAYRTTNEQVRLEQKRKWLEARSRNEMNKD